MSSYRIELRETRLATDGTDDVALFDVTREEDGATWIVPAYLSPLFRLLQMQANASPDKRRDTVAGLGASAIVKQLNKGVEPALVGPLVFTVDYPGAPGDPELLSPYEQAKAEVKEGSSK
ncbi:MAG: hypothetical protein PVG71_16200 [Anaerolineae bacterium]|jgi:hypothetical protein